MKRFDMVYTILFSVGIMFCINALMKPESVKCVENLGEWQYSPGLGTGYCHANGLKEKSCLENGGKVQYSDIFKTLYCKKECIAETLFSINGSYQYKYDCSEKF